MRRSRRIQQYSKPFIKSQNLDFKVLLAYQQVKHYGVFTKPGKSNKHNQFSKTNETTEKEINNKRDQLVYAASNSQISYYTTFSEDTFIPSVFLSGLLLEFKLKYSKIQDIHEKVTLLKSTIKQLRKECDSTKKSDDLILKLKPLVINVLLELEHKDFVEFHQHICFQDIKLDSDGIDLKLMDILKTETLIHKFNLLTCGSSTEKISLSTLRTPLTTEQKEIISKTYSTNILKFIITEIYGRFNDNSKINEYLTILRSRCDDDDSIKRFENFINVYFYNQPLNIGFYASSSGLYVLNKLASYLTQHIEVPKGYSDSFNEILLANYPSFFNHKILLSYYKICYGDLAKDLQTINYNKDIIIPRNLLSNNLSSVINKMNPPSNSIMLVFLYKYLSFSNSEKNIRSLISQFQTKPPNPELLKQFKFTLFHIANKIVDDKPEFAEFIFKFIHNKNEGCYLPEFENIDVDSLYSYYENDLEKFLSSINAIKKYEYKRFQVSSTDTMNILNKLNDIEKNVFLETLINNNVAFDDSALIHKLIASNPSLIDTIFSKDNASLQHDNSTMMLRRPILYFSPNEILKIITNYSDMFPSGKGVLKFLKPSGNDFEYSCAKLSTLKLKKTDFNNILHEFTKFLKENELCDSELNWKITLDQQIRLYNLFIMKVIKHNHFLGAHFACSLIPSFKTKIFTTTGIQESYLNEVPKQLILDSEIEFNNQFVYEYAKKYCENNTTFKLHLSLFKKVIDFSLSIEDIKEREEFQISLFKFFQSQIKPEIFPPITIFRLWQIGENNGIESKWKSNFNISKYFEIYYSDPNRLEDDKALLMDTFHLVGKYESSIELSNDLIEKIFLSISDKNKLLFIVNLRNALLSVPYIPVIETFIKKSFDSDPTSTLKVFGIEFDDPLVSNIKAKRAKWMKFDPRYYSCLIDYFMKEIISKTHNTSIKLMIIDSFSFMKQDDNQLSKVLSFYNMYLKVSTFNPKPILISSNNFEKLFNAFQRTFRLNIMDHEQFMPIYLYQPFIYHFLFTRIFTYDLDTIIKMLYVITAKSENLEKFAFWKMINADDKKELELKIPEVSIHYNVDDESKYMNLFRLLFTVAKNCKELTSVELSSILQISENLIKNEDISKKYKYVIMNCMFILITKHSDLLSAFYKKMKIILPDYIVSKTIIEELLYSTSQNDLGSIDLILTNLMKSHDTITLNQSVESVVKKLINEEEYNLAQELYLKYTERNHKFKITDLPEGFNWSKAKQPIIRIDSNAGVNMKMNKFKVKLYDYDSLSK